MAKEVVVLVHGLYLHGTALLWLKRRLEKNNWTTELFSYPSLRKKTDENAAALETFIANLDVETIHLVGHSLGGLLIRQVAQDYPQLITGNVVTLGTPHQGSVVARVTQNIHKLFIGGAFEHGLDGDIGEWPSYIPLGSIAGDTEIGIGWFYKELPHPNDGTVAVEETSCDGMRDHIVLPVSHTSMLYDKDVATQVDAFLRNAQFNHGTDLSMMTPC